MSRAIRRSCSMAPDTVWLIMSGRVDVFSVSVVDGRPSRAPASFLHGRGGRCTVRRGPGAVRERPGLPGGGHRRHAPAPARPRRGCRRRAARGIDGRDGPGRALGFGLSTGSSRGIFPHPRTDVVLEPGEGAEIAWLASGSRSRKGIVWVGHEAGTSLFLGMEDPGGDAGALFPVTTDTWMQALGAATVTTPLDGSGARRRAGVARPGDVLRDAVPVRVLQHRTRRRR